MAYGTIGYRDFLGSAADEWKTRSRSLPYVGRAYPENAFHAGLDTPIRLCRILHLLAGYRRVRKISAPVDGYETKRRKGIPNR